MPQRQAFTLLELLLTLAVLAAIAAVAIPQFGILLGDQRLVRSADQLRVEMTRLRVDSMRQGQVMMLEGQLEGGQFRVRPFQSLADLTESMGAPAGQSALLSGANQATATPITAESADIKTIDLAEEVVFAGVVVVAAARAAEIEQANLSEQTQGWSRPILFYPDGTTSTAAVTLRHETLGSIVVKLRGITGDTTLSEVLP